MRVKCGLGCVASVPVMVVDALAVPVEDVHVVDHLVLLVDDVNDDDDEGCVLAAVLKWVCCYPYPKVLWFVASVRVT